MRRKRECNFNVSTHPSLTEPDVNVYHTKCMYNCVAILYCDVHSLFVLVCGWVISIL